MSFVLFSCFFVLCLFIFLLGGGGRWFLCHFCVQIFAASCLFCFFCGAFVVPFETISCFFAGGPRSIFIFWGCPSFFLSTCKKLRSSRRVNSLRCSSGSSLVKKIVVFLSVSLQHKATRYPEEQTQGNLRGLSGGGVVAVCRSFL